MRFGCKRNGRDGEKTENGGDEQEGGANGCSHEGRGSGEQVPHAKGAKGTNGEECAANWLVQCRQRARARYEENIERKLDGGRLF